jgi:hypothetical protein
MRGLRARLAYILPSLHLAASLVLTSGWLDSGLDYLIKIDYPASALIVSAVYSWDHPLILFATLGTVWWYLLGRLVEIVGGRLMSTFRTVNDD